MVPSIIWPELLPEYAFHILLEWFLLNNPGHHHTLVVKHGVHPIGLVKKLKQSMLFLLQLWGLVKLMD
jgi:hypothetical protein